MPRTAPPLQTQRGTPYSQNSGRQVPNTPRANCRHGNGGNAAPVPLRGTNPYYNDATVPAHVPRDGAHQPLGAEPYSALPRVQSQASQPESGYGKATQRVAVLNGGQSVAGTEAGQGR